MKIIKSIVLDQYKDTKQYKELAGGIYQYTKEDGKVCYCLTLYAELEKHEDVQLLLKCFLRKYFARRGGFYEKKVEDGKRVLIIEVESEREYEFQMLAGHIGKRVFTYDEDGEVEIGAEPINYQKPDWVDEKIYKFNTKSKNPIALAELEKFEKENKIKFPEQLRNYWLTFGDANIKECNFKSDDCPTNLDQICFPFEEDPMKEVGLAPQTFFPIAYDSCGNYYYWNSADDKVYMVFHDDIDPEPFVFFESVAEMFERMEGCFKNKPNFRLEVSYNHPLVLQDRIKNGKKINMLLLFVGVIPCFLLTIVLAITQAFSTLLIVGSVFVVSLILFIVSFSTNRYNPKQNQIFFIYQFFDNYYAIFKNSRKDPGFYKLNKAYYYRKQENKQHVVNVYAKDEMFVLKMYTGTYNGSPVYQEELLPNDVFKSAAQRDNFKQFLRDILGFDFVNESSIGAGQSAKVMDTEDEEYMLETNDYVLIMNQDLYQESEINEYKAQLIKKYQQDKKQILNHLLKNGVSEFYSGVYGYDDETILSKLGKPTISIDMKIGGFAGHIAYCHSTLDEHLVTVEFVDNLKLSQNVQIDG